MSDNYVSDTDNTRILQEIYHGGIAGRPGGVSNDQILLAYRSTTQTRQEIVAELLLRYGETVSAAGQSAQQFLFDIPFSQSACLNSLYYPAGYANALGWNAWAGYHTGTWYNDSGQNFTDRAHWHSARQEGASASGVPYWFQQADFLDSAGTITRQGWNQSRADCAYLWGWDPKDASTQPDNGNTGAHLGFQHLENQGNAIFWFTKNECFFEAVATQNGETRRISVGLFGRGFWEITATPQITTSGSPASPGRVINQSRLVVQPGKLKKRLRFKLPWKR